MEKTWLGLDKAPDEAPEEVYWRRKGKDRGGEKENIEHRTSNIQRRSLDGRKGKFGTKFETKFRMKLQGRQATNTISPEHGD